jgi:hypothetical protein
MKFKNRILVYIFLFVILWLFLNMLFTPLCSQKIINITEKNFTYQGISYITTNETIYKLLNNDYFYNFHIGINSCYICNDTIIR